MNDPRPEEKNISPADFLRSIEDFGAELAALPPFNARSAIDYAGRLSSILRKFLPTLVELTAFLKTADKISLLLLPNGGVERIHTPSAKAIQDMLEATSLGITSIANLALVCDEGGNLKNYPLNMMASVIAQSPTVGPVVLTTNDCIGIEDQSNLVQLPPRSGDN